MDKAFEVSCQGVFLILGDAAFYLSKNLEGLPKQRNNR